MPNTQLVQIMIVEDHPAVIHGLCGFLDTVSKFKVVGMAKSIEEARCFMQNNIVDLVIMDIRLEAGNGIDLTEEFSNLYPDLAILIYSGQSDVELVRRARNAGARGYLLKGADIQVIHQAIEIIMAGGIYLDPDLPEKPKPILPGEKLTPSEEIVMRLFAQWMTNQEICLQLKIKLSTAKTHRNNIMWKLGINNTPELYREAIRRYGNPDVEGTRS
jgi:DNA-binding NarL/FixJ family response regulator